MFTKWLPGVHELVLFTCRSLIIYCSTFGILTKLFILSTHCVEDCQIKCNKKLFLYTPGWTLPAMLIHRSVYIYIYTIYVCMYIYDKFAWLNHCLHSLTALLAYEYSSPLIRCWLWQFRGTWSPLCCPGWIHTCRMPWDAAATDHRTSVALPQPVVARP